MNLTKEELKLINNLREIDRRNPLGIDGYTELSYIGMCQNILTGAAAEAERRYKLFLEESKHKAIVDLEDAKRQKEPFEDTRLTAEEKKKYIQNSKRYNLKPPKWEVEKGENIHG